MARGYPDYQNPVNQVAGRLVDFSGIQTAILGLATLDGLGRLVWFDRFHDGLSAWELAIKGVGVAPVITSSLSEIPPSCVKLGISAGGVGTASQILRSIQLTTPKTFGLEFSVLYNQGNARVIATVMMIIGGVYWSLNVMYEPMNGTIGILGGVPSLTYVTLAPGTLARLWIPIKLVLDLENGVGRRLVVGMDSFSLANIGIGSGAHPEVDQIYIGIEADSLGAGVLDQYIGHVYLTGDEP
jgi:hypothetical protein